MSKMNRKMIISLLIDIIKKVKLLDLKMANNGDLAVWMATPIHKGDFI